MPRSVSCPKCRAAMQVSSKTPAGKPIKCSRCGHGFSMPAADRQPIPQPAAKSQPAVSKPPSRFFVKLKRAFVLFVFLAFLIGGGTGSWWVYSRVQADGWAGLLGRKDRATASGPTVPSTTEGKDDPEVDTGPGINQGTGDEDPLAYLPPDTNVLIGLSGPAWLNHPVLKPLLEHGLVNLGLVFLLAECKKQTGLELADFLDTIFIALNTPPGDVTRPESIAFVVRTKVPFDQKKLNSWVSDAKPKKRNGKYYFDKHKEVGFAKTVYLPSNRLIVIGDRPAEKWADLFAADGSNPAISSEAEQLVGRVEKEPIWMVQLLDAAVRADVKAGKPAPLLLAPLVPNELRPTLQKILPTARGFSVRIGLEKEAFKLRYGVGCLNDAQALELTKALQASWARHKPLKSKLVNNALVLQGPERQQAVKDLVDTLEFTQQTWLAEAAVKVGVEPLRVLFAGGLAGFQDHARETAGLVGTELGFPLVVEQPLALSREEKTLLDMLNKFREKVSQTPLKPHPKLMAVARSHAANMAKQGKAEDELDGKESPTRVREGGYKFKIGKVDFNIAAGENMSIQQAYEHWTKPGAKHDVLIADFDETGLGIAKNEETGIVYFYQVFSVPEPAK